MRIEIIICTESGYLEAQSKLLIYSIRKFGGIIKNADIYSYNPRKGKPLNKSTIKFFEEHKVKNIEIHLNKDYINYAFANKPIVCAHREKLTKADVLIFLDSDTFFLKSPDFISDIKAGELFMRPVDSKGIGTDKQFTDDNASYWKNIYKNIGVKNHKTINTTLDNKEILEYYNAGMIITHVSNGLFKKWKLNFDKIMSKKIKPKLGIFFVEQSVLSATISSMSLLVNPLPKEFNCPIHLIQNIKNPSYSIDKISDIKHVHYHKIFNNKEGVNPLYEEFSKFENGSIINNKLKEFHVIRKNNQLIEKIKKITHLEILR